MSDEPEVLDVGGVARLETYDDRTRGGIGYVRPEPTVVFECVCGNECKTVGLQGVNCQECGREWKVRV